MERVHITQFHLCHEASPLTGVAGNSRKGFLQQTWCSFSWSSLGYLAECWATHLVWVLYVHNFSKEWSLKYRVSHMVISIIGIPPMGTGARKSWASGGCCSFKQDGESWPLSWCSGKTWGGERRGPAHIWAEVVQVRNSMCQARPWDVSSEESGVDRTVSDQESCESWRSRGASHTFHSYSECMGDPRGFWERSEMSRTQRSSFKRSLLIWFSKTFYVS